ncbi:GNAT family N-acetyltransferase [Actinoplanes sp. Pm04-4]|uniref:GNAT family N-acetyltransferase n=1 Tax=Paractinoplanes pyxinae TaxID=2997416 RepID=A0ABT4B091_9ACTN|nr:GNAT family N-acetyltransferase [Actinoplanes pyxinae]MCY1139908.1 GNAT family N-acetyltransferase [Actinoplanes pyxinae]
MRIAWAADAAEVAPLFDEYRVHYGQEASAATPAWLADQITSGRLAVATAGEHGFITVAVLPASLTLGEFWFVRDLFVPPRFRRRGVARALLTHVVEAARAAGARRVSLQTETGNASALALYASAGFRPVDGLEMLSLAL